METIIDIPERLYDRVSSIEHLNFLLRYPKTYVMDNHLAAGWSWLQELNSDSSYCFFHVDQHKDLADGGLLDNYVHLRENPHVSIEEYTALEYYNGITKSKVIRWDTYIKQVQHLFPNWFTKCFFACPDIVDDPKRYTDIPLNIQYNANPFELYNNVSFWVRDEREEFIFNLDIDYFFDNEGMRIFSDDYIRTFAIDLNKAMEKIAVLTIALSPECCGGWNNSVAVYNLIAEEIDAIDENPLNY